jgi:hypothetical protein
MQIILYHCQDAATQSQQDEQRIMAYEALQSYHWIRVPLDAQTAEGLAQTLEKRAASDRGISQKRAALLLEVAQLARTEPLNLLERKLLQRAEAEPDRDDRGTLRGCADAVGRIVEPRRGFIGNGR